MNEQEETVTVYKVCHIWGNKHFVSSVAHGCRVGYRTEEWLDRPFLGPRLVFLDKIHARNFAYGDPRFVILVGKATGVEPVEFLLRPTLMTGQRVKDFWDNYDAGSLEGWIDSHTPLVMEAPRGTAICDRLYLERIEDYG